ncbi:hypothetical protein BH23BAC2_BH23BAC2_21410 [soil metagenome]
MKILSEQMPGSERSTLFTLILISTFALMTTGCNNSEKTSADSIRAEAQATSQNMYVIEREIPGASDLTPEDLKGISQKSNGVLDEMGSEIKWLHSYVAGDKVYCVYTAPNEEMVREHARKGGFPANSVSKVTTVIDPSTGN